MTKTRPINLMISVLVFMGFFAFPQPVTAQWSAQTADSLEGSGTWTSIAVDSNNRPHISYKAYKVGLRYAYFNGTSWQFETVVPDTTAGTDEIYIDYSTSIALDSSDYPHISYTRATQNSGGALDYDVMYAFFNGASWIVQPVDEEGNWGMETSLVLDASGHPHISYYGGTGSTTYLKYAYHNGTVWTIVNIDPVSPSTCATSITLDSSGYPHISYDASHGLKYANYNGSVWNIVTVDSVQGRYSSLALDSSDNPHISYVGKWGTANIIMYAYHNGTSWQNETYFSPGTGTVGGIGGYTNLVLDPSDIPHICYNKGYDLYYASYNGSTWTNEMVDDSYFYTGQYSSMALDSDGHLHTSYYYSSFPRNLRYSYRTTALTPNPNISAGPASYDFGDVETGSSASQAITISNTGDADLNISGISITGSTDFGQSSACTTVAPAGSCTITVTFSPSSLGAKAATLSILSDDPDESPLDVALSGTGTSVLPLTLVVTTTSDSGPGSLRAAVITANDHPGPDTITFDAGVFPPASPATITLSSGLPSLLDTSGGTIIEGNGGVIINTSTYHGGICFEIRSNDNIIRGLQIIGFWVGIDFNRNYVNQNNVIGGTAISQRNIISDNQHVGITLAGPGTANNLIIGNFIGIGPSGSAALGTQATGIDITRGAHDNIIGGSTPAERNVISGNTFVGVVLSDTTDEGTSNNHIRGNYIGTDLTGMSAIPNDRGGIAIDQNASGNVIGGIVPGTGNVISGQTGATDHGIRISSANGNYVYGNIIGLSSDSTNILANGIGIRLESGADDNVIGGLGANQSNVISGNDRGIWLGGGDRNVIEGNYIGTDASGNNLIGNRVGIRIDYGMDLGPDSVENRVGPDNHIWFNTEIGIRIDGIDAVRNTLTRNSIKENISQGIDLSGGANGGILPPSITLVTGGQITGTTGVPDGSTVEIFQDAANQGNIYVGSAPVSGGAFTFSGSPPSVGSGGYLTATVTDLNGNTSEFSDEVVNNLGTSTTSTWFTEIVDDDGYYAGEYSSLEIDASNHLHIGYYDGASFGQGNIKYAYFNGSSWSLETVDTENYGGAYLSLALDSDGNPNFSYNSNGDLKHAYKSEASWIIETVDPEGYVGIYTSIAVDSANHPHISYTDMTNKDLKYARFDGSNWQIETVDSEGYTGLCTSLALDSSDYPHISYYDYSNHDIKYASYNGDSWNIEIVDADDQTWKPSLALDSWGDPHISYLHLAQFDLKYAKKNGDSWQIETVDTWNYQFMDSSLVMDSYNNPHISYTGLSLLTFSSILKYAFYDGSLWSIETVDSATSSGRYNSLALDAAGNPHISYMDEFHGDLKYAYPTEISISDSETVSTPGGDLTVSISGGSFTVDPVVVDVGGGIPDGFVTPFGAVSFEVATSVGETITVILNFPDVVPWMAVFLKCDGGVCSEIMDVSINGNQVIYQVTDGGPLDGDDSVNAKIVDPLALCVPAAPEVAVDIKPGACPNPFNVKSKGVLPLAVLGTEEFDVNRIDPASLRLEKVAPKRWAFEDVATPFSPFTGKQYANDCTTVGPDGQIDLTVQFDTQELVAMIEINLESPVNDGEVLALKLTGKLKEEFGSAPFEGEDVVVILKK
jgi:hypothetical protein